MTQADRTQLSEIEIQRHSFAHVLAMAALRVFKNTKIGIGAVVDNGFYQDFQFETPIGKSDLEKIEREMQSIIEEEVSFQQLFVSKEQAFDILNLQGQIFKTEILQNIAEEQVSFYRTGKEFIDLCRGPHVDHTGKLGAFKLISISGVYWNNDKTRPQLQRILGVSFPTEAELSNYFKEREAKKEKDHRKLGQKLDLFTFVADNGSGLPIWLPKGFSVIDTIRNFVRKEQSKAGYTYVSTPSIVKSSVFEDSSVPQSKIYNPIQVDDEEYVIRPDNLELLLQVYKSQKRSYRDLPFKLSEFAHIFRHEKSGELTGLSQVREFIYDSNIVVCTKDQIEQEVMRIASQMVTMYKDFGLKQYKIHLAMRGNNDSKYIGSPKEWYKIEQLLIEASKKANIGIIEAPNSAPKYGPQLNFTFEDVYGREWNLGNITIEIQAPNVHKLFYVNSSNKDKTPMLISHSLIGSIERFFSILLEQRGGIFPLWFAPIQVITIPISEKFNNYAQLVTNYFIEHNINAQVNTAPETMQNKIRDAQLEMIPYMVIVGEKEAENKTISVRPRSGQDLGMMKLEEFKKKLHEEIENKIVF